MTSTPRPKDGSPWLVPPHEAKVAFVHTENGVVAIKTFFDQKKLRPDQLIAWTKPKIRKSSFS